MALTLRVTSFHNQALGADGTRVFGAQGGAIGRALDNDWVLPDPEKFVSSRHAEIVCRGGSFFLKDTSTNGTFVNGSPQPVGNNHEQQLFDGDRILIADYEISVALDASAQQGAMGPSVESWQPISGPGVTGPTGSGMTGPTGPGMTGPTGPTGGFGTPASAGSGEDILDIFDESPSMPSTPGWAPPTPDHASVMDQNFVPPPVASAPPAADSGGGMIPENWDETGFVSPESVPSAPPPAAPQAPAYGAPPQAPSSATELQAQPPLASRVPLPEPAAVSASDQTAMLNLLMAAGIDQANAQAASTPANIAALGQILGITTQGLIDVLTARSAVKSQFRVPMTMMRPVENNALKSSANSTEALINLLVTQNPAYLSAVEAFAEGFEDVKAHQMALMAGMRAAFDSMLERFDPAELEERFKKRKSKSMLRLTGSALFWEMYKNLYDEMTQDADANFQRLFGEEFARAYEEQMQRLTAGRGRFNVRG